MSVTMVRHVMRNSTYVYLMFTTKVTALCNSSGFPSYSEVTDTFFSYTSSQFSYITKRIFTFEPVASDEYH